MALLRKVIYNTKMRLRHRAWAEPNKAAQPSRTTTNRRTPRTSLGILEAWHSDSLTRECYQSVTSSRGIPALLAKSKKRRFLETAEPPLEGSIAEPRPKVGIAEPRLSENRQK